MGGKKSVSGNVTIALRMICVVLTALLGRFTVTGISTDNSFNNLQNQNQQLQTWLVGNETLPIKRKSGSMTASLTSRKLKGFDKPLELGRMAIMVKKEIKKYTCAKCSALFSAHPPDDRHEIATRNEKDYEDHIRADYRCKRCGYNNTIYWGSPPLQGFLSPPVGFEDA